MVIEPFRRGMAAWPSRVAQFLVIVLAIDVENLLLPVLQAGDPFAGKGHHIF
jgi:hypothetical protein